MMRWRAMITFWTRGRMALAILATVGAVALPLGTAGADGGDTDEQYPPAATQPPVRPTPAPALPATGNDGSDAWLKTGAGAIVIGGIFVTAAARRRVVTS